jgi:hypothetical protein
MFYNEETMITHNEENKSMSWQCKIRNKTFQLFEPAYTEEKFITEANN